MGAQKRKTAVGWCGQIRSGLTRSTASRWSTLTKVTPTTLGRWSLLCCRKNDASSAPRDAICSLLATLSTRSVTVPTTSSMIANYLETAPFQPLLFISPVPSVSAHSQPFLISPQSSASRCPLVLHSNHFFHYVFFVPSLFYTTLNAMHYSWSSSSTGCGEQYAFSTWIKSRPRHRDSLSPGDFWLAELCMIVYMPVEGNVAASYRQLLFTAEEMNVDIFVVYSSWLLLLLISRLTALLLAKSSRITPGHISQIKPLCSCSRLSCAYPCCKCKYDLLTWMAAWCSG